MLLQITGLAFSSVDPEYVYVQGVDYEVTISQLTFYSFHES